MSKQSNYEPNKPSDDSTDATFWQWLGIFVGALLLILLGFAVRGCTGPQGEIEVTRIVPQIAITEQPVTRIVEGSVEVTRLVLKTGNTEIPVTRIVTTTAEIEVTRIVPEIVVTEVPVTRVNREVVQIVVTKIIPIPPGITVTPGNGRGCTRFDLEMGRNQVDGTPEDGTYLMQEPSGHQLATWTAKQGWLDSGWLRNLPQSQDVVHVQVYFYPASGTGPIPLEILNHAPDLPYGWVSNDQCHAVEIQFPE